MEPTTTPFVLRDLRRPGEPLTALPLKVPAATADTLQALADRLGCARGTLARDLLARAVAELQAAIGQGVA